MTSKEFTRRCKYFESLSYAKFLFYSGSNVSSIYKYTLVNWDGSIVESYFSSLLVFVNQEKISDFRSFWVDEYRLSQFRIDYSYFLAFYNRCSEYQKSVLRDNSLLKFLLEDDHSK